jgi:hypothetical protein
MLMVGGGALGALASLGAAAPARALAAWTWGPSGSVAGSGAGADPRGVWDAEADPLVASLLERGEVPRVNELLRTWTRNDQPLPAGLPDDLHAFIEQARRLPSWADPAKLARVADFTKAKGTYLILGYGLGSGMMSTAIPGEARAVYYSKGGAAMKDRVAKTTKLGIDLHELNAFQPDGHIMVTAVKTRLVHAAVRHLLPQSPGWSRTGGGRIPISQNEILITWHSLPTFVKRKLTEWQVPLSSAESDAFLHLWQVNAHLLGVLDEYIPASWAAAEAQSKQILDPAMGPTTEGTDLAETLLTMASQAAGPAAPLGRPLLNALTRYVAGDQVADWVAVPREPVWDPLIRTGFPQFVALREKLIPLPLIPPIAWTLDEAIRQLMMFYLSEGKPVDIVIPDVNRPG